MHAARATAEDLGPSDGTPGQELPLMHGPVLPLEPGETLEVLDAERGEWTAWDAVESFIESGPDDSHFRVDLASGTVEFGPSVRMPDGTWRQHGEVPAKGSPMRMSRYRYGGGRTGNVAAQALTVLKTAVPTVASVANRRAATGGIDAEDLASARARAAFEFRTRYRAVTADDFEFLCGEATPRVARALCIAPAGRDAVRVHLVPRLDTPARLLPLADLVPDDSLFEEVAAYLDERRLIGTHVELLPAVYRGVSVVVNVQTTPRADAAAVEDAIATALYGYLNPLVGGSLDGAGEGWQFGRALNVGELYGVVQAQPGVDHVKILRVYETDLATGQQEPKPTGTHVMLAADELIASGEHMIKAEPPEVPGG
jgi:predicted phage baseplate assembly protein